MTEQDTNAAPNGSASAKGVTGTGKKMLYASVALNLLLGGILIGGTLVGHRGHHPHRGAPPMAMRDIGFAFMRELPPERRKQVFEQSIAKSGDMRPLFEEARRAREAVFVLLEGEKLDTAAFAAASAKVREADSKAQARAAEVFIDIIASMPADERRAAALRVRERWSDREEQRMRMWSKHDHGPHGFGPDDPPPPPPPN